MATAMPVGRATLPQTTNCKQTRVLRSLIAPPALVEGDITAVAACIDNDHAGRHVFSFASLQTAQRHGRTNGNKSARTLHEKRRFSGGSAASGRGVRFSMHKRARSWSSWLALAILL